MMRKMCSARTVLRWSRQPAYSLLLITTAAMLFSVGVGLSDGASVQIPEGLVMPSEENLESIESLAQSKILMDRTTSLSPPSLLLPTSILKVTGISQSSSPKSNEKGVAAVVAVKTRTHSGSEGEKLVVAEEEEVDIRSPLIVAQCRAQCLDKFTRQSPMKVEQESTPITAPTTGKRKMDEETSLGPNLLRLQRRKRFSDSGLHKFSSFSSLCFHNSSECLSCWKSCQLLETSTSGPNPAPTSLQSGSNPEAVFPPGSPPPPPSGKKYGGDLQVNDEDGGEKKEDRGEERKSKHPILACSKNNNNSNKQPCKGGCQVACAFYEGLVAKNGGGLKTFIPGAVSDEPVVATRHENVVNILPGKITWPGQSFAEDLSTGQSSVVYVVIQEYPDRKWRQIAQTTELELRIPSELTAAMKQKLRSVRVLVVGREGLRSVYRPRENSEAENKQVSAEKRMNGKDRKFEQATVAELVFEEKDEITTIAAEEIAITTTETNEDSANGTDKDNRIGSGEEGSDSDVTQEPPEDHGTVPSSPLVIYSSSPSPTTEAPGIVVVFTSEPFELRLVSLIHQKSLVIAELRWDEIGSNPNQEYLITWELTGGGLKGHLVTDSTSVTLSLWPDTTYQIQVEQFQQTFLDSDGEQQSAADGGSSQSQKSLPLIVDTSVASFPLARPSALLGSKSDIENGDEEEEDDYRHDEDEFTAEEEVAEEDDEYQPPGHKSFGEVVGVVFVALVLVLAIFTLVAFTWTKLRMLSVGRSCEKVEECGGGCGGGDSENGANGCFSCCFNGCTVEQKDIRLLASQEDLSSEESASFYASPLHYVLSLKNSQYHANKGKNCGGMLARSFARSSHFQHNFDGQQDEESTCSAVSGGAGGAPVAVISSGSLSSAGGGISSESAAAPCSLFNCYYNNVFPTTSPALSTMAPANSAGNCSS